MLRAPAGVTVAPMIRLLALLLTVLTGFSGLVYEVTWQRYLATLLGSHSEATAAVLGLFLGGLAVGYSLFGAAHAPAGRTRRAQGRAAPLLIVYGAVEASIGALRADLSRSCSRPCRPSPSGFPTAAPAWASPSTSASRRCWCCRRPYLMGGTIPILTQALARCLDDATRFHALVYAFNTAGAFAGALAAGYWLVPSLGLVGVLHWMGGINLLRRRQLPAARRAAARRPRAIARRPQRRPTARGRLVQFRRRRAADRLRDDDAPDAC